MLTVEEALAAVLDQARPLPPRPVPLTDASGLKLAEAIVADLDLPPFDKALMDGYAVRSADCDGPGPHHLTIGEEITAGRTPTRALASGEAAVIMTGAPLPPGADAVVMHENTAIDDDGRVQIPGPIHPGMARLEKGREMRLGQELFRAGDWLTPLKLGVLAGVGKGRVLVIPRPRVVILPTGDELVPIAATPGPGQIRETNSTALAGLVRSWGGEAEARPPARDNPADLFSSLEEAMAAQPDILLISGGVSAGKRDLVPGALESLGVRAIFHKVRLKPGKPLLFGVGPAPSTEETGSDPPRTLVFGLPGNPVSNVVGFLLFVAPALQILSGANRPRLGPTMQRLPLAAPFHHRGDRATYHPARMECSDRDGTRLALLEWAGSADLYTVSRAHGFARFPEGNRDYSRGEEVDFICLSQ